MMFFIEDQFTFYFIFFNLSYIIENIKKCHPYRDKTKIGQSLI